MSGLSAILFIGLVCEDVIINVDAYPAEDTKLRTTQNTQLTRGGNAANSAIVSSLLGQTNVYFLCPLCNRHRSSFVINELNKYNINTDLCSFFDDSEAEALALNISKNHDSNDNGNVNHNHNHNDSNTAITSYDMTVSYIIVSNETKSRTIINNPRLPALKYQHFMQQMQICNDARSDNRNNNKNKNKDASPLLANVDALLHYLTADNINLPTPVQPQLQPPSMFDKLCTIHIELRWISAMEDIVKYITIHYPNIFLSIEIEKERLRNTDTYHYNRSSINSNRHYVVNEFIKYADLVFFSKQLIVHRGYSAENPTQFIQDILLTHGANKSNDTKCLTIVCPWGDCGVYAAQFKGSNHNTVTVTKTTKTAKSESESVSDASDLESLHSINADNAIEVIFNKAYPPMSVIDTIGAGDTFIGAFLYQMQTLDINATTTTVNKPVHLSRSGLELCLDFASKVAGFKVGQKGFDCVKHFQQ